MFTYPHLTDGCITSVRIRSSCISGIDSRNAQGNETQTLSRACRRILVSLCQAAESPDSLCAQCYRTSGHLIHPADSSSGLVMKIGYCSGQLRAAYGVMAHAREIPLYKAISVNPAWDGKGDGEKNKDTSRAGHYQMTGWGMA